jgi:hypothetical protein
MLVGLLLPKANLGNSCCYCVIKQRINSKFQIHYFTAYCRLPNTIKEFEKHSKEVLKDLPSTTIVAMSLLANSYTDLIQDFLSCNDVKA